MLADQEIEKIYNEFVSWLSTCYEFRLRRAEYNDYPVASVDIELCKKFQTPDATVKYLQYINFDKSMEEELALVSFPLVRLTKKKGKFYFYRGSPDELLQHYETYKDIIKIKSLLKI